MTDAKQLPEFKICDCCGKKFHRKQYRNGKLESAGVWLMRRYCSQKCNLKAAKRRVW